jgi:hypothetical protein
MEQICGDLNEEGRMNESLTSQGRVRVLKLETAQPEMFK